MKWYGKPLTAIAYNDFHREFPVEINFKKTKRTEKIYFKEDYLKIRRSFAV